MCDLLAMHAVLEQHTEESRPPLVARLHIVAAQRATLRIQAGTEEVALTALAKGLNGEW